MVPVEALLPLVSPRAPFPRTFHATVLPGWAGGWIGATEGIENVISEDNRTDDEDTPFCLVVQINVWFCKEKKVLG